MENETVTIYLPGNVPLTMVRLAAGFGCDEFWMAETQTTIAQWNAVTGNSCEGQADLPITEISFEDSRGFCAKLSEIAGAEFRIPFDREWCRAVGVEPPDLENYAVFEVTEIAPVKSKRPNEFGLYDMRGNAWEWIARRKYNSGQTQLLRGGSWFNGQDLARSVYRYVVLPAARDILVGCRVVCVVRPPSLVADGRVAPGASE